MSQSSLDSFVESLDNHVITGKGAGGMETATAIVRDLVAIKRMRTETVKPL
jgi:homoserine dehydrogenase